MTDIDTVVFRAWPKTPRLFRDMCITEKIDGTNAAIHVTPDGNVVAQSRNRLIYPDADNYGFAKWAEVNAADLAEALGEGIHYGEWWGNGIQRGYGLANGDKRFSLFNIHRYADVSIPEIGLGLVSVLYQGAFDTDTVVDMLELLVMDGSSAAPGFMRPEGIVIYHEAARSVFKVTCENDEKPKGQA